MFEKIKKWLNTPVDNGNGGTGAPRHPEPEVKKTPRAKKPELTPKEKATAAGEPYIAILQVDLDPNDLNNGSFDLDWNDKFVTNLIKQGYRIRADDTDAMIVDRWFQTVCRNIALEVYEQEQADPDKRESEMRIIQQRDLGGGFTEVS
jgi:hypothetical protein